MTINIEIHTHRNIVNVKQKAFIKRIRQVYIYTQYVKYSRQSLLGKTNKIK